MIRDCRYCGQGRIEKHNKPKLFKCDNCEKTVHEAVAENWHTLQELSKRDDKPGAYARKLLESGGVS